MPKIEICVDSYRSARNAQEGGAHRIELCDSLSLGGITPSFGKIKYIIDNLDIKTNVLIRPRSGDFYYSKEEFEIIKNDIILCKKLGVNGIVIGFLNKDGTIDLKKIKEIISLAEHMEITFHRAIDMTKNIMEETKKLLNLKINRILSSGGRQTALEGIENLRKMINLAKGTKTIIMPGSGINDENFSIIHRELQTEEYHASLRKIISSNMIFKKSNISMGQNSIEIEYSSKIADKSKIKKICTMALKYTKSE